MKSFKDYIIETVEKRNRQTYYRGTNNAGEETLVCNKKLQVSTNALTKEKELGVSVSDVPDVGKYFKYLYTLSGKEIGEGSDGEPLLDPDTIEFIEWVNGPE